MTILSLDWRPPTKPLASDPGAQDVLELLSVAPIRLTSGPTSAIVVPGELIDLSAHDPIQLSIDLPRVKTISSSTTVPAGEQAQLLLDTDGLLAELAEHGKLPVPRQGIGPGTARGDAPAARHDIKTVRVDIETGGRTPAPAAASHLPRTAELAASHAGVTVTGSLPVSLVAKVASRRTLPRYMNIPYAGPETNACRIVPVTPVGARTRLRVEPADPVAVLLMDFLLAEQYGLAGASARAIERQRAERDPAEWAQPSFCQLLIGYAYAFAHDTPRLLAWCRRTDAGRSLGTDGLILQAEAAHQQLDWYASATSLYQLTEDIPPLLVHGADLGLRLTNLLLVEAATASPHSPVAFDTERLDSLRSHFSRLLFVADAESSPLSTPIAQDPTAALAMSRREYTFRLIRSWVSTGWRNRYTITARRPSQYRQYLVGASMSDTSTPGAAPQTPAGASTETGTTAATPQKLAGAALWTAIFAVIVWVAFSTVLIVYSGRNETQWTRIAWVFGSIQAVAFAAAGALFGTAVQQQSVNTAQQQATSAQQDADQQRESAIKGRALATAIQAEAQNGTAARSAGGPVALGVEDTEPDGDLRQRHAQLSRALFGDLI